MVEFNVYISDALTVRDLDERGRRTAVIRLYRPLTPRIPIVYLAASRALRARSARIILEQLGSANSFDNAANSNYFYFSQDFNYNFMNRNEVKK